MRDAEDSNSRSQRVRATVAFFTEIIRFIVIPMIVLDLLLSYFPFVSPEFMSGAANNVMLFGGMIAIFVALEAYFPKGHRMKLVFGVLGIAMLCSWFWFLLGGEEIHIPYGQIDLSLDVSGLITVILCVIALKALIPVVQYADGREEIRLERLRHASATTTEAAVPVVASPATGPTIFVSQSQKAQIESISSETQSEDEPPPPEDFRMKCPVCKTDISIKDDVCPECGAWIRLKKKL